MTSPDALVRQETKLFREEISPGQWEVNYNWPQMLLMESQARVPVMQCGVQVGKTSVLAEWITAEMEKCGPGDYLWVSPTYPLFERRAYEELQARLVYIPRGTASAFEYQPGRRRFVSLKKRDDGQPETVLWIGSAENPESLASTTLKGAAFDEAAQSGIKREVFIQIFRGLAVNRGRLAIGTTIYGFGDAYKAEIYDKWVSGDPTYEIIQADSIENPAFPEEEYYRQQADLPVWLFNMRYRGIYERPTGLIYDVFDESTQIVSAFDYKLPQYSNYNFFTGHDFGPNNTCMLLFAQDPSMGWVWLVDEYLRGDGMSVAQHVEQFKARTEGLTIMARTGGAGGKREQEIRDAYSMAGWPINAPGLSEVEAGILQCYSFMAKNQLFVFRDCYGFLNEISRYSRKLDENYEVMDDIHAKATFHRMDAMRAAFSSLPRERVAGQRKPPLKTYADRGRSGLRDRRLVRR